MCSFIALGLTEHEASDTTSFLDEHDMALMKAVVEQRKERTVLAGGLLKLRAPNQGGRQRGGGRGNTRDNRRDTSEQDRFSSRQSRGKSTSGGGDEAEQSTSKGSKDGSNKSTSTLAKKFVREKKN